MFLIRKNLQRPRQNVAQWWTERLAPRRLELAKEARVSDQDVFRPLRPRCW